MNQTFLALIVSAVVAAVNNLEKNMHLLDGVTSTVSAAQEMNSHISNEHKGVIARLEVVISKLRSAQNDSVDNLQLNVFELFSVNKAVNEHIVELEKAMAYFSQMGQTEQLIQSFQAKIRDLHFATFALLNLQGR